LRPITPVPLSGGRLSNIWGMESMATNVENNEWKT
jgi:hypothetical protein